MSELFLGCGFVALLILVSASHKVAKVISQLEELKPQLSAPAAKPLDKAVEYYRNNQKRMLGAAFPARKTSGRLQ